MNKNEVVLHQGNSIKVKKAKNQLSTVLRLIQNSDQRRLVAILKSINQNYTRSILSSLPHIHWTIEFI
ncbi:hypothetical protein, partial [Acinetobacter indicus]|uniref:hypothetical protein n=1 Tax=Acinetobacter indicus TaxID=756892 RepID=UPI001C097855